CPLFDDADREREDRYRGHRDRLGRVIDEGRAEPFEGGISFVRPTPVDELPVELTSPEALRSLTVAYEPSPKYTTWQSTWDLQPGQSLAEARAGLREAFLDTLLQHIGDLEDEGNEGDLP